MIFSDEITVSKFFVTKSDFVIVAHFWRGIMVSSLKLPVFMHWTFSNDLV